MSGMAFTFMFIGVCTSVHAFMTLIEKIERGF